MYFVFNKLQNDIEIPADKINDFFFLNDEQEDEEFGANSNHKRASELAAQIFN